MREKGCIDHNLLLTGHKSLKNDDDDYIDDIKRVMSCIMMMMTQKEGI